MKRQLAALAIVFLFTSCGVQHGDSRTTTYQGTVISTTGRALPALTASIFETGESGETDENGDFLIESFKHFSSVGFFFEGQTFSNTVRVDDIPAEAVFIQVIFLFDEATGSVRVSSVSFGEKPPAVDTPEPGDTPRPGETPTPERPGNFDSNGNTTAFGIPKGLKGNITRGRRVWGGTCSSCHGAEKTNRSYSAIQSARKRIPDMRPLAFSNQEIADVVAYLNRGRK